MSHPVKPPPQSTERLFPEGELRAFLEVGSGGGDVLARLLEEGETEDLRWMTKRWSREEVADFVRRFGARCLSRRSRRFWSVVLDVESGDPPAVSGELWLL